MKKIMEETCQPSADVASCLQIISKADIIAETENLVLHEGLGYAEAIVHICTERNIEIEDIAKLISGPLREKLKAEAQRNNYLPKPSSVF